MPISDATHRPAHRVGRTLAALTATVGLAAVAGCSGPASTPPPGPDQGGGDAPASASPAQTLPRGVKPAAIPTKVANRPADRKNVVMTGCQAADKGWQANGTATNPSKEDVDYQITVFFTTTAATTINSASAEVSVKPGETVKWTAKKDFTAPKEMLCVLRGVAAAG